MEGHGTARGGHDHAGARRHEHRGADDRAPTTPCARPAGRWPPAGSAPPWSTTRTARASGSSPSATCSHSVGAGQDPDVERVGDHLTDDLVYAAPSWTLEQAAEAMMRGGFRHLVVLDQGEVAGILSVRDIVRCWAPSDRVHRRAGWAQATARRRGPARPSPTLARQREADRGRPRRSAGQSHSGQSPSCSSRHSGCSKVTSDPAGGAPPQDGSCRGHVPTVARGPGHNPAGAAACPVLCRQSGA